MATSIAAARELLRISKSAKGLLVCAPHIVLSPTYRAMHADVLAGKIGKVVLARARYGWAGPWWGQWYYRAGGGALFDLGIYNLMSLCGFMGPVRRVCAMVGTAIPKRMAEGVEVAVQSDDNAQVLLDFGESRFACITTGFTMQKYRSPAIELTAQTASCNCSATIGRRKVSSDGPRNARCGRSTRKRAPVAVDRRLAAPRRVRCRRNAARQPA